MLVKTQNTKDPSVASFAYAYRDQSVCSGVSNIIRPAVDVVDDLLPLWFHPA